MITRPRAERGQLRRQVGIRLHREPYKKNGSEKAQIRQSWRIQEKNKEKRANKRSLAQILLYKNSRTTLLGGGRFSRFNGRTLRAQILLQ